MINDGMDNFDAWLSSSRDYDRWTGVERMELDAEREAAEARAERAYDEWVDEEIGEEVGTNENDYRINAARKRRL